MNRRNYGGGRIPNPRPQKTNLAHNQPTTMDKLNKLEQLEAYLGEEETTTLIQTMEMLEDKMDNSRDEQAIDFYRKISGAVQELQQAVYEAKNFYE